MALFSTGLQTAGISIVCNPIVLSLASCHTSRVCLHPQGVVLNPFMGTLLQAAPAAVVAHSTTAAAPRASP
jgi:hypothetical protein